MILKAYFSLILIFGFFVQNGNSYVVSSSIEKLISNTSKSDEVLPLIDSEDCGSEGGTFLGFTITDCTAAPCNIYWDKAYVVETQFMIDEDQEYLTFGVLWIFGHLSTERFLGPFQASTVYNLKFIWVTGFPFFGDTLEISFGIFKDQFPRFVCRTFNATFTIVPNPETTLPPIPSTTTLATIEDQNDIGQNLQQNLNKNNTGNNPLRLKVLASKVQKTGNRDFPSVLFNNTNNIGETLDCGGKGIFIQIRSPTCTAQPCNVYNGEMDQVYFDFILSKRTEFLIFYIYHIVIGNPLQLLYEAHLAGPFEPNLPYSYEFYYEFEWDEDYDGWIHHVRSEMLNDENEFIANRDFCRVFPIRAIRVRG